MQAYQVALVVKNLPANAGDIRDVGSIPGLRRSLGEGNSYVVQYSCLENPMDRRVWWATVHSVAKSQTQLKQLSMNAYHLMLSPYFNLSSCPGCQETDNIQLSTHSEAKIDHSL